jgi:DNA-directed RNA polymerase specialized sigma24 family protein
MTNSVQDNSEDRRDVSQEAFACFLECLSPDSEEAGRRYMRLHKKLVGFFNLKGVSDPVSAADETIDRATLKIAAGTPVPDVDKYCMGIARNIARERWRRAQREHSTFLDFTANLANNSDEGVERIYRILKPCFDALAVEEQKLIVAYCQVFQGRARADYRRQLAESMNTTVLALRMRVTRIRSLLSDCVTKSSNEGLSQL